MPNYVGTRYSFLGTNSSVIGEHFSRLAVRILRTI
jgi:hypothetical protein